MIHSTLRPAKRWLRSRDPIHWAYLAGIIVLCVGGTFQPNPAPAEIGLKVLGSLLVWSGGEILITRRGEPKSDWQSAAIDVIGPILGIAIALIGLGIVGWTIFNF